MTYLVVWFRDGELHKASVCCGQRVKTRTANRFNEYAQLYNRVSKHVDVVGIIRGTDLANVFDVHTGMPKHGDRAKLKAKREIRQFKNLPVRGRIQ